MAVDVHPSRRADRWAVALAVTLALITVATVVGLVALWPDEDLQPAAEAGFAAIPEERIPGRITAVAATPVQDDFLLPGSVSLEVEVALDDGRTITVEAIDEAGLFTVGRRVEVAQVAAPGTPELFAIVDLPRGLPLAGLAALFVLAVVALGRWQGVRALAGLVITALLIIAVGVPALLAGRDPTVVALVVAVAVMLVTLPLSHGLGRPVLAAAVGTTIALALTVGLALVAVEVTALTGLASEDVQMVRFATGQALDLRGLLLAGMIVGTLGVLDDVTVSQASTVAALRRTDPAMPARRAFAEALTVGRDHIAATVNTLFLAYAGAALPLLILFNVGGAPIAETLTSELVAQEIVRTLVGSIGLIAAVPVTTALAALAVAGGHGAGHAHPHGHAHPPVAAAVGGPATAAGPATATPGDGSRGAPPTSPARTGRAGSAPGDYDAPPPTEEDREASLRRLFRLDEAPSQGQADRPGDGGG